MADDRLIKGLITEVVGYIVDMRETLDEPTDLEKNTLERQAYKIIKLVIAKTASIIRAERASISAGAELREKIARVIVAHLAGLTLEGVNKLRWGECNAYVKPSYWERGADVADQILALIPDKDKEIADFIKKWENPQYSTPGFIHLVIPVKVANKFEEKE